MKKKLKDKNKTESESYSICKRLLFTAKDWWYLYRYRNEFLDNSTRHPGIYRMKSLMRRYVYIEWIYISKVKSYKGFALAAKVLPIKSRPWPETDCTCLCLHITFADPLYGSFYLIVVDSFSM